MKNKKGFTLIELLAVIVILAIIALIATPIVLNIINETKESAQLRSTEFYIDGVEYGVTKKIMYDPTFKPISCEIQSDGNLKCNGTDVKVEISGEKPTSGTICLSSKGTVDKVIVKYGNYYVSNDGKETKITDKDAFDNFSCDSNGSGNGEPTVQLQSGLYDAEDNLIVTWDELVNDYGIDLKEDRTSSDQTKPGNILSSDENLSKGVKLVIDSSVTEIGDYAFMGCTSLKEIVIPNSVTSIGWGAFANTSLTSIVIPNSVTSISGALFLYSRSLKEVILPEGLEEIGNGAFGLTALTSINIPNSVTSIGEQAFAECTSLEKITMGNSVTSIGERAFENCKQLTSIILPNGVTSIGHSTFYGCKSLTSITIPNSVTSIGHGAFGSCSSLKTINYTGTQDEWNSISILSAGAEWDYNLPNDYVINYNYAVE